LITNMRSNDVHVGLPHDVFCFTMLQEIVARSIGVELGTYKHVVGSLHLYDRNSRAAKRFLDEGWQATNALMPSMPEGDPWVHIRTLLELESEIREAPAPIDLRYDNLPPYWADILRLLHMYRLRRDGDGQRITEVRDSLSSTLYRPFADRLLRQLATTGKFNLL